jgi:hypothetical protein
MGTPLHSPTFGLLDPLLSIKPQAKRTVCKKKRDCTFLFLELQSKEIFISSIGSIDFELGIPPVPDAKIPIRL